MIFRRCATLIRPPFNPVLASPHRKNHPEADLLVPILNIYYILVYIIPHSLNEFQVHYFLPRCGKIDLISVTIDKSDKFRICSTELFKVRYGII